MRARPLVISFAFVLGCSSEPASAPPVNSPASAHNAIGIGAHVVVSRADYADQSRGPTPDGLEGYSVKAAASPETVYYFVRACH